MVFSSLFFLWAFLPVVFVLYLLIRPLKWRNVLLVIASLLFYAYGEPVYILLMLASILANYIFGLQMNGVKKKLWLTTAVVFNIGLLVVFKYAGMLVVWINTIFQAGLPVPQIALPVGISFFTFQALSYVIDVYRQEVQPQKSLMAIMLYISFFPQLIAGPIVKYHDIQKEIDQRKTTWTGCALGLRRFSIGLAKKVMIANPLAYAADSLYAIGPSGLNTLSAWMLALAYLFQIYFDFSGYSDMAIGLGRLFGFHFKENFNYPYISCSIQEFWRRWHISLSTWFKEYLYIPLGGNRKGKVRTSINKLIVFVCTGLWHGANLTFLFWGLWHGAFILLEQWVPLKKLPRLMGWLLTMLIVVFGFVIFRADTLGDGLALWKTMVTFVSGSLLIPISTLTWLALMAAVVFSMPVVQWLHLPSGKLQSVSFAGSLCLFALCGLMLAGGGYNPFIYFRF